MLNNCLSWNLLFCGSISIIPDMLLKEKKLAVCIWAGAHRGRIDFYGNLLLASLAMRVLSLLLENTRPTGKWGNHLAFQDFHRKFLCLSEKASVYEVCSRGLLKCKCKGALFPKHSNWAALTCPYIMTQHDFQKHQWMPLYSPRV